MAASAGALAAGSGPAVNVQIKNGTKTLKNVTVHGEKGSITKGGTPKGKCPGSTAAGALDAATHGNWTGKYYPTIGGIFISSILGVKPTGSHYWAIYVNGKLSNVGACKSTLKSGEKLLFKVT